MMLNLNNFTITDDGDANSPTQISVGVGGQIILHSDGSLEVATGVAGFTAEGLLIVPEAAVAADSISPNHTILVRDSAGYQYLIPALRVS